MNTVVRSAIHHQLSLIYHLTTIYLSNPNPNPIPKMICHLTTISCHCCSGFGGEIFSVWLSLGSEAFTAICYVLRAQLWFSRLESWPRDISRLIFKVLFLVLNIWVLVLVFWLFFGHELALANEEWRRTFVSHGPNKALFTNLCCVLIVESLNGGVQLHHDY